MRASESGLEWVEYGQGDDDVPVNGYSVSAYSAEIL